MLSQLRTGLCCSLLLAALSGCGGGGGGSSSAPATVSFTASATDVPVNGTVTLTWSSTNAPSCTASGGWSGALATSGAKPLAAAATATYTIACGTATASVTVTTWNAPSANLSVDTTTVLTNNPVTLTWTSANAVGCVGGGGLPAAIANSGTLTTPALTTTTSYSIACSNPAFPPANSAVTVTVNTTLTLSVAVAYVAPGPPVVNAAQTYYVPDWAHPLTSPVPLVYVELDDASGAMVQSTYADSAGVANFVGLDPSHSYTPKIQSRIQNLPLTLDFVVLNNTVPLDTSQPLFRARYAPYVTVGSAYTPVGKSAMQSVALTVPDGWDATTSALVDGNRVAGPYELLAVAVQEALTISAAIGGTPTWKPLTILWSVKNKGGLALPPNNYDLGTVTGSGGYYDGSHPPIDASGSDASTATRVSESFIYLSGDQTQEPMEIYPFVMSHEMGHFIQTQFSTIVTPGGDHSYSDDEDALLAWIEGNASGIAALVLNTPQQRRLATVSGEIVVGVVDISNNTISGNPQTWPIGWYQESTTTNLIWSVYDPGGTINLSAAATLAPMFSNTWLNAPWVNTIWAYVSLLAQANPSVVTALNTFSAAHNITAAGNDVWGSTETHVPPTRMMQDVLPPYTSVAIGQTVNVCSAGVPLEYNKSGNFRLLRLLGDGAVHTLSVTGPAGSVPVLGSQFTASSITFSLTGTVPAGGAVTGVGDCAVSWSEFSTDEAACMEPTPPNPTCWSVTLQ